MRISDWSSDVCSSDLAHCAPPATAAFHFRVITRVVPSAIIGIIGGRRRIAGAMALDRAFIATLVTAAVGRFIGAVPGAGPAPLGVIGATPGAIVDFARYAVGIAGVDARIGIGGGSIVQRPLFRPRLGRPHQPPPPPPPKPQPTQ